MCKSNFKAISSFYLSVCISFFRTLKSYLFQFEMSSAVIQRESLRQLFIKNFSLIFFSPFMKKIVICLSDQSPSGHFGRSSAALGQRTLIGWKLVQLSWGGKLRKSKIASEDEDEKTTNVKKESSIVQSNVSGASTRSLLLLSLSLLLLNY